MAFSAFQEESVVFFLLWLKVIACGAVRNAVMNSFRHIWLEQFVAGFPQTWFGTYMTMVYLPNIFQCNTGGIRNFGPFMMIP